MFISVLDLFKIGIGPSSSHTMGPMVAAHAFRERMARHLDACKEGSGKLAVRCILKGSLAATGKGHATDRAVALGLHGHLPQDVVEEGLDASVARIRGTESLRLTGGQEIRFRQDDDIVFDEGPPLPEHPNGMIFQLLDATGKELLSETWFSIGGGFVLPAERIGELTAPIGTRPAVSVPFPFDSARAMLEMAHASRLSIAEMKRRNELTCRTAAELEAGLERIWDAMQRCVERGLGSEGVLPGGLGIRRRAGHLHRALRASPEAADAADWLCAYAMAVNEENAAGRMVVTAPTNGAAGVVPAVLYHLVHNRGGTQAQVRDFLLTAAAIGGLIKHRSSISGAEVGCQGEVGSASAMAAAGLCAALGGSPDQVEQAAEIALEHHLGMTCDPVGGLVQVPCIERNGFGAIKAWAAASLALREGGRHFVSLDRCIAAMKQIGEEMSEKFKETARGGLAVTITEC